MGRLGDVLLAAGVIGLAALGIGATIKEEKKEAERVATPCVFPDTLSQEEFAQVAISEAKKIKRLWVEVDGHIVRGTVHSVSGLSKWQFILDYNDFGTITGKYWKKTDNGDSSIPDVLGGRISDAIRATL